MLNSLTKPANSRLRHGWKFLCAGALFGLGASLAHAVPSYARQTGAECAACHVGSYGPQLTPYGIQFKIGGYTDSDGKEGKVPLSAMLVANWTQTAKAAPGDPTPHFASNNNTAMQEASIFLAGRFTDNIGSFVQATYSGVDRKSVLDQVDIRYAHALKLGDKEATVGLSLNNNPTLTDPFNTLGAWRFPYTSSDFNAGFGPSPVVENLGGGVLGLNAYAFYDNSFYAELGLYNSMTQAALNIANTDDPGKFKGLGTYGRVAYFKNMKRQNFSVGLFGFDADIQPDRSLLGTADKYRDLGIDASYQFLGNREHIFTLTTSYVKEWQKLNFTAPDETTNHINQFRLAGSYHYNQTWGLTAGVFDTHGSAHSVNIDAGSQNGRPTTSGYMLQADWTPWGKENSWGAPFANVRLGVQYTGYTKFMGGSTYTVSESDGSTHDRNARDNNTLMLFLWTSI